jgi:hypothetical protein
MADHDMEKVEREEEIRRRKKARESAPEKVKAQDEKPEANVMDAKFVTDTSALLSDARFAHSANAGQKAHIVRGLQRSYGNTQVQRLLSSKPVQAKLTVNPSDDQYEREADRVADALTQTQDSQIQRGIRKQKEEVQMKASSSQVPAVSEDMEMRINVARGSGQPLPGSILAALEPNLKHDFSQVRIHDDAEGDKLSQQLGANAFTSGRDVFFREGAYQPGSESGRRLIGHEMAHVVQQDATDIYRQPAKTEEVEKTKATNPKEEAAAELKKVVEKLRTKQENEHIKALLQWTSICMSLGMAESRYKWALEEATETALKTLGRKTAALDVKSAKKEVVAGLLNAAADVILLGGDEKAVERALKKALDWAEVQLASAMKMVKAAPAEANYRNVAARAAQVCLLGRDPTEAWEALTPWIEKKVSKAEPGKAK